MKFNLSQNEWALSVPKNSIPVEDYGNTMIKPNKPNAGFLKENNRSYTNLQFFAWSKSNNRWRNISNGSSNSKTKTFNSW